MFKTKKAKRKHQSPNSLSEDRNWLTRPVSEQSLANADRLIVPRSKLNQQMMREYYNNNGDSVWLPVKDSRYPNSLYLRHKGDVNDSHGYILSFTGDAEPFSSIADMVAAFQQKYPN